MISRFARLLSHRIVVMKDGHIIESGLTDRVLDDPQAPTRNCWSHRCWRHELFPNQIALSVEAIAKGFTLHLHGGTHLPVIADLSFSVYAGECVVLGGPSGAGKSSVLKMLYGKLSDWQRPYPRAARGRTGRHRRGRCPHRSGGPARDIGLMSASSCASFPASARSTSWQNGACGWLSRADAIRTGIFAFQATQPAGTALEPAARDPSPAASSSASTSAAALPATTRS